MNSSTPSKTNRPRPATRKPLGSSEVVTRQMTAEQREAMSPGISPEQRDAIRQRVSRLHWNHLTAEQLESRCLEYASASPIERAVISAEVKRKSRQALNRGQRDRAYLINATLLEMKRRVGEAA